VAESGAFNIVVERIPGLRVRGVQCWVTGQLWGALSEGSAHCQQHAESAVNQVVSVRMAKKQQMRWTEEGAHVVALVRVADLNGELPADAFGQVTRPRRSAIDRFWAESMSLAA